jgi:hypothetical protein
VPVAIKKRRRSEESVVTARSEKERKKIKIKIKMCLVRRREANTEADRGAMQIRELAAGNLT